MSSLTGGNIAQGFLGGAISGAIFGGVGGLGLEGGMQILAHTAGGAASGAANAATFGQEVGISAAIGAMSAGVAESIGSHVLKGVDELGLKGFSGRIVARSVVGGVSGGAASAAFGSNFSDGFRQGATNSAIAGVSNHWLHEEVIPSVKKALAARAKQLNKLGDVGIAIVKADLLSKGGKSLAGKISHGVKALAVTQDVINTVNDDSLSNKGKIIVSTARIGKGIATYFVAAKVTVEATMIFGANPCAGVASGLIAAWAVDNAFEMGIGILEQHYQK